MGSYCVLIFSYQLWKAGAGHKMKHYDDRTACALMMIYSKWNHLWTWFFSTLKQRRYRLFWAISRRHSHIRNTSVAFCIIKMHLSQKVFWKCIYFVKATILKCLHLHNGKVYKQKKNPHERIQPKDYLEVFGVLTALPENILKMFINEWEWCWHGLHPQFEKTNVLIYKV